MSGRAAAAREDSQTHTESVMPLSLASLRLPLDQPQGVHLRSASHCVRARGGRGSERVCPLHRRQQHYNAVCVQAERGNQLTFWLVCTGLLLACTRHTGLRDTRADRGEAFRPAGARVAMADERVAIIVGLCVFGVRNRVR